MGGVTPTPSKATTSLFSPASFLIADTFDAMTSTRPYRKALSKAVAFKELEEFSGTQFDPNLLKHFMKAMSRQNIKNENTFTLTIIDGEFEKEAA